MQIRRKYPEIFRRKCTRDTELRMAIITERIFTIFKAFSSTSISQESHQINWDDCLNLKLGKERQKQDWNMDQT